MVCCLGSALAVTRPGADEYDQHRQNVRLSVVGSKAIQSLQNANIILPASFIKSSYTYSVTALHPHAQALLTWHRSRPLTTPYPDTNTSLTLQGIPTVQRYSTKDWSLCLSSWNSLLTKTSHM